jgi:hypothetical protein
MSGIWFKVALFNFLLAGLIGLALRWAFVGEIPGFVYRAWQHAHSHVALLGWLYLGIYALFVRVFVDEVHRTRPFYRYIFWLTQASVVGMLVTFPQYGYHPWSIGFTVMHGLLSYAFLFRLWRDHRVTGVAKIFLLGAGSFLILSTLALWAFPFIISAGLKGKALYYMAVQFYLHFQFNGWLLFSVLALFYKYLQDQGIDTKSSLNKYFFWLLTVSCILTYAQAVTWADPKWWIFLINSVGVTLQMVALLLFIIFVFRIRIVLSFERDSWFRWLARVGLSAFVIKIMVQAAVVIPHLATISYTIRNYVISFIHLILIGIVTFYLIAEARHQKMISFSSSWSRVGLVMLFSGFLFMELLLAVQGTMFWAAAGFLPQYYVLIFGVSALIPLGVGCLFIGQWARR